MVTLCVDTEQYNFAVLTKALHQSRFSILYYILLAMLISMAGHVIFEMGSGRSLSELLPTEEDYEKVRNEDVRKVLRFIFNLENSSFKKVL